MKNKIEGILITGLINKQMSPATLKPICNRQVSIKNDANVKLLIINENKPKSRQSLGM